MFKNPIPVTEDPENPLPLPASIPEILYRPSIVDDDFLREPLSRSNRGLDFTTGRTGNVKTA
jgi:hypothetical protein